MFPPGCYWPGLASNRLLDVPKPIIFIGPVPRFRRRTLRLARPQKATRRNHSGHILSLTLHTPRQHAAGFRYDFDVQILRARSDDHVHLIHELFVSIRPMVLFSLRLSCVYVVAWLPPRMHVRAHQSYEVPELVGSAPIDHITPVAKEVVEMKGCMAPFAGPADGE